VVFFKSITFSLDTVEYLLAREHAVGRFEELPENLKFLWSQIDGLAVDQDFMTIEVHPKIPHAILGVCSRRRRLGVEGSRALVRPVDPAKLGERAGETIKNN
jgi:hypothetical protein